MSPARRSADHARLATLVVEALDRIATPGARFEVLDRALLLAKAESLPTEPSALLEFVDGPLYEAVLAILGPGAATLLLEQLGVLIARSGVVPASQSEPPVASGPRTIPAPGPKADHGTRKRSDVVPSSSRRGSGAYAKPPSGRPSVPEVRMGYKSAPARRNTLTYEAGELFAEQNGEQEPNRSQRVVVVDDDPNYRRAMVRMLDASGYEVNAAPNGQTALWMCDKLHPDLVVTDYELGDTNGIDLADEITRRLGAKAPPIILVTASAALPKHQPNIARVMVKSIDDDSLIDAAAELLAKPMPD
jgi:CheY-like chemotaxis protein